MATTAAAEAIRHQIAQVFAARTGEEPADLHARCGPFTLRLRFATPAVASLFLPAFVPCPARAANLDILFTTAKHHALDAVVPQEAERPRLLAESEVYAVWQPAGVPVLFAMDLAARRGIAWLPRGDAPPWVRSRPAIALVHALMRDTPWCAVHGAAVGHGAGFALLAGEGHSGKTTAALACAQAGWQYAGDDFVAVHSETGQIEPLFCSARLRPALVQQFRGFIDAGTPVSDFNGEPRHELSLAGLGERIGGGALRAIFIPRRRGAASPTFAPARASDAFRALLPTTAFELPGWPDALGAKVGRIARLAPVFFADTGTTPTDIPQALARQLAQG